jgi:integrase
MQLARCHTYANFLKNQGENLETIQKLCRHKHISTTATFYLDTSEDAKLKIANKIAKPKFT